MEDLFARLYEVLQRQKEIVGQLYESVEKQIGALRDADLEALMVAVQGQANLAGELARLEDARHAAQAALEAALGLGPDATLRQILAGAPEDIRDRLKTLGEELRDDLAALREANNVCRLMTRRALEFNTRVLQAVGYGGETTYGAGGEVRQLIPPAVNRTV